MITNFSEEKTLKNILEKLSDLGYDISEKSNIRAVIESLFKVDASNTEAKNKIFNSLNFENREGKDLDDFLNFFGIRRYANYNDKNKSISFSNSGSLNITIKENSYIKYKNEVYICYAEQNILKNSNTLIHVEKVNSYFSDKYSYYISGDISILLDGITVDGLGDFDNKLKYLVENLVFLNFNETIDSESDFEYINRSNSILQSYGDANLKKIKNYIKGIDYVSDVIIDENDEDVKLIIVPSNVNVLDQVIEQAKEAVDYFKTSRLDVVKPSIMEIEIKGLLDQLTEWFDDSELDIAKIISELTINLNTYLKELYFSNNKRLSRDTLEFVMNKYFVDNKIQFSIDEKKIKILYYVFTSDDYNSPVVVSELSLRGVKEILADICIMRGVN